MFRQSMVFPPPVSRSEAPQQPPPVNMNESSRRQQMASSSPPKSHPLHNFSLSDLKWPMNHTNTHRLRKASEKLPLREADPGAEIQKGNLVIEKARNGVSSSSPDLKQEKNKGSAAGESDRSAGSSEKSSTAMDGRSKILIRIRPKSNNDAAEPDYIGVAAAAAVSAAAADDTVMTDGATAAAMVTDGAAAAGAAAVTDGAAASAFDADVSLRDRISGGGHEAEEFAPKTWNLRPRKRPTKKRSNGNSGEVLKNCGVSTPDSKAQGTSRPESTRSRNSVDAKIAAESKEKKQKFSISLTKMEIDEDIFALTGSKPSRRPKKRARNVQKQLDVLFPGLWMGNVTPDAYKVSDHAPKA